MTEQTTEEHDGLDGIAVVGVAGRFPGAPTIEDFWRNLCDGVESIRFFTDDQLAATGVPEAERNSPRYVPAKGALDDIAGFDAAYFGFSPREAALLDPQQRLFLELCVEVLERAGVVPGPDHDRIGVFGGVSKNTYLFFNLLTHEELRSSPAAMQTLISNDKDYLATRASFKLGLSGPSLTVQTACSSSMVAVHLACQSLLLGECDHAIAGGVAIDVPHEAGYVYEPDGIFSPDGHCRAFDADARGTVFGQGGGTVLLRRLPDALRDGDPVLAVILGSAVNNDGGSKLGFTAPSVEGQRDVIAEALATSGVAPETVGYVEAHGTGTPLGDPIEVEALTKAFRMSTDQTGFCHLGAVKTNVGHLNAAAGITGLIKAVLALRHGRIPATLHFTRPSPRIDFGSTPFTVNARTVPWTEGIDGFPRRAGVSSFGIGGTNVHVVLEEAPPAPPASPDVPWQVLPVSARTPSALQAAVTRLHDAVTSGSPRLADVAATLQTGRRAHLYRHTVVARDRTQAAELLATARSATPRPATDRPKIAFLYPGQGSQRPGMARSLYEQEPAFRTELDDCSHRLVALGADDPRDWLLTDDPESADLTRTERAQPALFVVEYALTRLLGRWGIRPDVVGGHSLGEIVAATVSGIFDLDDALRLVAARARLIGALPSGAMAAIRATAAEIEPHLPPEVTIAAHNAPELNVISGPAEQVADAVVRLSTAGHVTRPLETSHAFHSAMMDPAVAELTAVAARLEPHAPRQPCLSNVTGTWLTPAEAGDPAYWGRHLREPVRFADGMAELLADPDLVPVEVGPGRALTQLVRSQPRWSRERVAVSSLSRDDATPDRAALLAALGRLWEAGAEPDWAATWSGRRNRVVLPTYPFERSRHWIAPRATTFGHPSVEEPPIAVATSAATLDTVPPPVIADSTAAAVASVFSALLGVPEVAADDDFFDLGGTSLLGVGLVAGIRESLGVTLPLRGVFELPTPAGIAALADNARRLGVTEAVEAARTDATTDIWFDGQPSGAPPRVGAPADVLLTGATGFLGSFLLRELLDRTDARIRCLVRAADPAAGLDRLRAGLERYGLLVGADLNRLTVLPGDLSGPRFGLADDIYAELADQIDTIYHNGAKVSFLEPYRILRRTNVDGVREALRLACTGPLKRVHHVSTIAVFDCDRLAGLEEAAEDADLSGAGGFHGGYDESKWAGEQVAALARKQGVPITIYRPGNIAGHSDTGMVSDGHLVTAMIKGCVRLGLAPDTDAFLDVVPVDYVSRALVALSLRADLEPAYNLVNPVAIRWNDVVHLLNECGYHVRPTPLPAWREAIRADAHPDNAMRVFLPMLDERALFSGRRYRSDRTRSALTGTGIDCRPLDRTLMTTYLRALVATGELPAPDNTMGAHR